MNLRSVAKSLGYRALRRGWGLPPAAIDYLYQHQLLSLIRTLRANCVLDVGANQGWFSQRLRWAGFQGRIVTFEPIAENNTAIAAKADIDWRVANYALGEVAGTSSFNILSDPGGGNTMSSFLEPAIGLSSRRVDVEVKRLEDVLPSLLHDVEEPRIFLKIDTQGFDVPVLRGAGSWLPRIVGLQSEVSVSPIYEGMTTYTEALAIYQAMGFGLVDLQVVNRTAAGTVLEYDCLMKRL